MLQFKPRPFSRRKVRPNPDNMSTTSYFFTLVDSRAHRASYSKTAKKYTRVQFPHPFDQDPFFDNPETLHLTLEMRIQHLVIQFKFWMDKHKSSDIKIQPEHQDPQPQVPRHLHVLHILCVYEFDEFVQLLEFIHSTYPHTTNWAIQDEDGQTPLHLAILHKRIPIVQKLLQYGGFSLMYIPNKWGHTPFQLSGNFFFLTRKILPFPFQPQLAVPTRDEAYDGTKKIRDILVLAHLEHHRQSMSCKPTFTALLFQVDQDDKTALSHAICAGNMPLLDWLLRSAKNTGAGPILLHTQDSNGHTPFHYALLEKKHPHLWAYLVAWVGTIETTLNRLISTPSICARLVPHQKYMQQCVVLYHLVERFERQFTQTIALEIFKFLC